MKKRIILVFSKRVKYIDEYWLNRVFCDCGMSMKQMVDEYVRGLIDDWRYIGCKGTIIVQDRVIERIITIK